MFEYEFENDTFTQEQVDNRAKEKGVATEQNLSDNPSKNKVEREKTKGYQKKD